MNDDQRSTASLGVDQYIFVLRRQWRLIAVFTLLGALVAGAFLLVAPRTVTATTTINLNVITTEPFSAQRAPSGLLDDATETAIARSHVVASRASEMLDGAMTANQIRGASTVTTSSGAAVVTVDFEAGNGADAVEGADAVAAAYLSFRSDQADERISVMVTNLTERIDALNVTLGEVNQALTSADEGSAEYAQATTQRQQILTELDGLLSERNGLQSVDTTGGIVLTAAEDNDLAYAPSRTVTLLSGVAGGLVLGLVAAFVRNPRDRRLRNASEMARALGAPVFATVDARKEDVPAVGEAADALRVTRERLLVDLPLGTAVLVIDATRSTAIASTAVNLAVVTAQAGHDVQLIVPEASDEFRERLGSALSLRKRPGANDVFTSGDVPTLRYFAARDVGNESQGDLLLTRDTQRAIDRAGDEELTFLVLSSSAHPASILAALRIVQSVVVVFREKGTLSTEVKWLREEAESIDTRILGAVAEKALGHSRKKDDGIAWPFHQPKAGTEGTEGTETAAARDADDSLTPEPSKR